MGLVQGAGTPVDFASTAAYTGRNFPLTGFLGSMREETTYQFLPLNGFSINQANTNIEGLTTITRTVGADGEVNTGPVSIFGADGSVNLLVNDDVEDWDVEFTRTFTGVPVPANTQPADTSGPYVYQNGDWRKLVPLNTLQAVVADSTDFNDFKTRVSNLR